MPVACGTRMTVQCAIGATHLGTTINIGPPRLLGPTHRVVVEMHSTNASPHIGMRMTIMIDSLQSLNECSTGQGVDMKTRRYCWRVGVAWEQEDGTRCGECGLHWENGWHRDVGDICGWFVKTSDDGGRHCTLAPSHAGPHKWEGDQQPLLNIDT